jgi:hypothetical protein
MCGSFRKQALIRGILYPRPKQIFGYHIFRDGNRTTFQLITGEGLLSRCTRTVRPTIG